MRFLNLVFQGGGVKGIAYAGALQFLPDNYVVKGFGGSSAGALVAALLAIGKRGDDLRDVLKDPELFKLLRQEDAERYERIKTIVSTKELAKYKEVIADGKAIWSSFQTGGFLGIEKAKGVNL